jgi:hypothetical protein
MTGLKTYSKDLLNKALIITSLLIFAVIFSLNLLPISSRIISLLSALLLLISVLVSNNKLINISRGILIGILLATIFIFIYNLFSAMHAVKEWDFMGFYFFGKLGVTSGNFYDPIYSENVFNQLNINSYVSADYISEIVKVGFWYPPPSMLLLFPLGLTDVETASFCWRLFILLSLIISIIFALKIFLKKGSDLNIILMMLSFFLIFEATSMTLDYSQTNFLLLLFLLLVIKNIDNWKSGIFLALAVIIKPIAIIWSLYYVLNKKFKILSIAFVTGTLICAATAIFFGYEQFTQYIVSPPTDRLPDFIYGEKINQSLYSILLKISQFLHLSNFLNIRFISVTLSAILVIMNIFAAFRIQKHDPLLAFMSFIPLSLLIYPASLTHYSVLLVPIYFYFILKINNNKLIFLLLAIVMIGIFINAFLINLFTYLLIMLLIKKSFYDKFFVFNSNQFMALNFK